MSEDKRNIIREKAMNFSVRMYHLNEFLIEKRKYSIADQVFRSGTSIGPIFPKQ